MGDGSLKGGRWKDAILLGILLVVTGGKARGAVEGIVGWVGGGDERTGELPDVEKSGMSEGNANEKAKSEEEEREKWKTKSRYVGVGFEWPGLRFCVLLMGLWVLNFVT